MGGWDIRHTAVFKAKSEVPRSSEEEENAPQQTWM